MRSRLALVLTLSLAVPRIGHAGGWTREQHAAVDEVIALANAGKLADAITLATAQFAVENAPPGFRRAVAREGRAAAEKLFAKPAVKDDATTRANTDLLCPVIEMMRVYKAKLVVTDEDRTAVQQGLEGLEALASARSAPCAPRQPEADPPPPPGPGARATVVRSVVVPRQEGPARPPSPAPVHRSRAQVGVGAGLIATSAGFAAGVGACFAASARATESIRALDKRATDERRELTMGELASVHDADRRYAHMSNTGKTLGVLAGLSVVAAVIVLAMPPRNRVRARAMGAGVHINF